MSWCHIFDEHPVSWGCLFDQYPVQWSCLLDRLHSSWGLHINCGCMVTRRSYLTFFLKKDMPGITNIASSTLHFLGAFPKLRTAIISFVKYACYLSLSPFLSLSLSLYLSVCPPAWNNWAPTVRIFMKFDIYMFVENLWRKFKSQ